MNQIGKGMFGDIIDVGYNRVVKMYQDTDKMLSSLSELDILSRITSKSIIKVVDEGILYPDQKGRFKNGGIVLEKAGGDLSTVGDRFRNFLQYSNYSVEKRLNLIIRVAFDIVNALDCLHNNNYIHLDLRPKNILYFGYGRDIDNFKLTDFGQSQPIGSSQTGVYYNIYYLEKINVDFNKDMSRKLDNMFYCAPEIFEGKVSASSDIWSLGVTLLQLMGANWESNMINIKFKDSKNPEDARNRIFECANDSLQEIRKIKALDPNASKETIQLFDFIYAFIKKCLVIDPRRRTSTDSLLSFLKTNKYNYYSQDCKTDAENIFQPVAIKKVYADSIKCFSQKICRRPDQKLYSNSELVIFLIAFHLIWRLQPYKPPINLEYSPSRFFEYCLDIASLLTRGLLYDEDIEQDDKLIIIDMCKFLKFKLNISPLLTKSGCFENIVNSFRDLLDPRFIKILNNQEVYRSCDTERDKNSIALNNRNICSDIYKTLKDIPILSLEKIFKRLKEVSQYNKGIPSRARGFVIESTDGKNSSIIVANDIETVYLWIIYRNSEIKKMVEDELEYGADIQLSSILPFLSKIISKKYNISNQLKFIDGYSYIDMEK